MNKSKIYPYIFLIFIIAAFCPNLLYADSGESFPAFTIPSADVTLSFLQPGRIDKIKYRKGETVIVGDSLVQQYDAVERAKLEQLEADSLDTTQVQASEARLEQSKVELKARQNAPSAVAPLELENAKLNQKIAELSLRLVTFQLDQAVRKFEEAKLQIENMNIKSPIDGYIEEIFVEEGESVNALDDVVRVVRIDPLWIDVKVPLAQSETILYGQTAVVRFPSLRENPVEGTVIFKSAVADSASETLNIRIQVPNRTNRPAGEKVMVSFPDRRN